MRHAGAVALFCAATVLAGGCGRKSPTGPTPIGSTPVVNTFVGVLIAPGGLGGSLQLKAASTLASRAVTGPALLSRLLTLVEPLVLAQGSTASGVLVTDTGGVVSLSGTFSDGTFNVSGGGYTIVATVTGTSVSGTATVPGGATATVRAPDPVPVTGSPPADPSGTYAGSYRIDAVGYYINTLATDGSVVLNCPFTAVINGDLSLQIVNGTGGQIQARITGNWVESQSGTACPNLQSGPVSPAGPIILDYSGPATGLTFGTAPPPVPPGPGRPGLVSRAESFTGAVSGNTAVILVSRSFRFTNTLPLDPPRNHVSGYPTASTLVTLVKQ